MPWNSTKGQQVLKTVGIFKQSASMSDVDIEIDVLCWLKERKEDIVLTNCFGLSKDGVEIQDSSENSMGKGENLTEALIDTIYKHYKDSGKNKK